MAAADKLSNQVVQLTRGVSKLITKAGAGPAVVKGKKYVSEVTLYIEEAGTYWHGAQSYTHTYIHTYVYTHVHNTRPYFPYHSCFHDCVTPHPLAHASIALKGHVQLGILVCVFVLFELCLT